MLATTYHGGGGLAMYGGLGGFALERGVAVPDSFETLGEFQGLQRAINAGRRAKGLPLISVDGEIGTQTLNAAKSLQPEINTTGAGAFLTSVDTLARNARVAASGIAATFGAGTDFTPVAAVPRPTPAPSITPEEAAAALRPQPSNLKTALIIGAIALGGIVVVTLAVRAGKKKPR